MTYSPKDKRAIALRMAKNGTPTADISAATGLSSGYVTSICRSNGIRMREPYKWKDKPKGRKPSISAEARAAYLSEIMGMRSDGKSVPEIAAIYGVTPQSIYNLASKAGTPLGQHKPTLSKSAKRDVKCVAKWGCTYEQYQGVLKAGATQLFANHRQRAKKRAIPFEMTLWEWWSVWQKSGKWDQRGNRRDQYVMARKGDVGPYSVKNVYITTQTQNMKDAVINQRFLWSKERAI